METGTKPQASLRYKLTEQMIDYCNVNNIDLIGWYKWQLHIMWQRRKIGRDLMR